MVPLSLKSKIKIPREGCKPSVTSKRIKQMFHSFIDSMESISTPDGEKFLPSATKSVEARLPEGVYNSNEEGNHGSLS